MMGGIPKNRMGIALLSLTGFFVSLYLLSHSLGLLGEIRCGIGDCNTVQASEYAWVGPIPVSGIGVAGYAVLLAVALAGLQPRFQEGSAIPFLLLAGTSGGVAFALYLTYLEAAVINAWCQWCVTSAVIIGLAFLLSLPEIPRFAAARRT